MAAACITSIDLTTAVPDLASFAGPELDEIVATTCDMLHVDIWGDKLSRAHLWLAAHFATVVLNPSEAAGMVASRTLDKISESYVAGSFEDAEMSATKYGRLHMALRKSLRQKRAVTSAVAPPDWSLPDGRIH